MGWPVIYQSGVVYLKLLMNFIAEFSPCSTRSLITKLQELSVHHYEDENTRQVCSAIKGEYKVLLNKRELPPDFLELVFGVFDRYSVERFVLHMCEIKINHNQCIKVVDLTYLLKKVEQKYQEIEDWNGEKVQSVFIAG